MAINQFLFGGGVVVIGFIVMSCVSARLCLKFRSSYSRGVIFTSCFYGDTDTVIVIGDDGILRVIGGIGIATPPPAMMLVTVCALPELGVTVTVAVPL